MSNSSEIIFEVTEDEVDGGYSASALGYGIHTQAETEVELRQNVREAVECYFDETMQRPRLIRLLTPTLSHLILSIAPHFFEGPSTKNPEG